MFNVKKLFIYGTAQAQRRTRYKLGEYSRAK